MRLRLPFVMLASLAVACASNPSVTKDKSRPQSAAHGAAGRPALGPALQPAPAASAPDLVTISLVETADVHGHVEMLPLIAGAVANLRRVQAAAGGAVLLVDGGDMFQGTLESNLGEGDVMVRAFGAMGYVAAAVGNHEFDFGPAGDGRSQPGDDLRGALKARATEARFPFLCANLFDAATGGQVGWPNMPASAMIEAAGVKIGFVGVTSVATPSVTSFFHGLQVMPLAETIVAQAAALRASGAQIVVVLAHAGGRCRANDDPADLSSCVPDEELFRLAEALPAGTVDALFGGHNHGSVAHVVNGIPVAEAAANGEALARIDVVYDRKARRVVGAQVQPPHVMCSGQGANGCQPGAYAGAPVVADAAVAAIGSQARDRARSRRDERLGFSLVEGIPRRYQDESPLGNLLADLMRVARPGHDIAMINAGGVRADLPAGELTYGQLYEVHPFDNRFATVRLRGGELKQVIADNLTTSGGLLLVSGLRVKAVCRKGQLTITLRRDDGRPIRDRDIVSVLTSDFLATGGDKAFGKLGLPESAITLDDGLPIRDGIAGVLRGHMYDVRPAKLREPRILLPGKRPLRCEGK